MPPTLTLYGYGKMALAIAKGLSDRFPLEITGRNPQKIEELIALHGLNASPLFLRDSPLDITDRHLLLCVKPYALGELSFSGEAKGVYSILAGVSIERLREKIPAQSYIRAMPNMAASLGSSCTALCGDESLKILASEIFAPLGTSLWLDKESKIDAATALAGSGPAYLALMAEALMDAGVREGLSREESKALTQGLFSGFADLLKDRHPALIKEEVTSPGGTTAEALALLESKGLRGILIEAVHTALLKAKKL